MGSFSHRSYAEHFDGREVNADHAGPDGVGKRMSMPLGTYFIDRNQPELSSREASIVRKFQILYYDLWLKRSADTINLSWFGYRLAKCPLDLWIYQELLTRTRPDFVIETGTYHGGSALYFAMIMDLLGHGRIITIDIDAKPNR